jgi:hypothetical protein
MALENSEQVARTWDLIERSRREILLIREDIQSARAVIDQSRKLLSDTEPTLAKPS